jgi:immunity protein, SdpI family
MRRWLPATLIAGAVLFSLAVYSRLPDEVPVHWAISGEPNRFGSRLEGAFLIPAMMIVLFAILQWYPSRDPRASNIAKFRPAYDTVVTAMIALLTGLHVVALGIALGWRIDMPKVGMVALGLMFILLGNLMPLARSNFIFGFRTPWTLSSESVWTRSHRVGGYAMVLAGIITIVAGFVAQPVGYIVALASLLISGIVPFVYSYILWSRSKGGPSTGST